MIPVGGVILIYFRMVRYVKRMSKRVTPANTLSRAQRELKMVHRIVRLVSILLVLGLPYTIFVFMGLFNRAPKYDFRIAYTFFDVSLVFIMIALFQFTDPVKTSVMKKINRRPNTIVATVT
jgi:Na+/phosphate symporter